MDHDPLRDAIAETIAILDPGPDRKRACGEAGSAFLREHGASRSLLVAVGTSHAGWCIHAYGETDDDIAGLPGTYRTFPVRVGVGMARGG